MTGDERHLAIDQTYSTLMELLEQEPRHGDDCVWRCLNPECGGDHGCGVCDDEAEEEDRA